MCTRGMERDEGWEKNKGGLRWVTHQSLRIGQGSQEIGRKRAIRVQCQYQQDHLQMNATISPHQTPLPPRRAGSGGEQVARLVLTVGESVEREREALTWAGMCWRGCRRTFAWLPRLRPSWTTEHGLSTGLPVWSGDDMNEIKRNTPNRRSRSCWGRNRNIHPQRQSEKASQSRLWIKADGYSLLCAGFSCLLGSRLFLALWGSVRGFEWPYKTTARLTLPPPHRKQARGELGWHLSPLRCHTSRLEAGVEENTGPLGAGSVSISALSDGRRVQQHYRSELQAPKVFPSVEG